MATCDPNTLLAAGRCYICLGGEFSAVAKLALMGQYLQALGGTLPTPATLINDGRCWSCLTLGEQRIVELQMLCNTYRLASNQLVGACSSATLLADGACFTCLDPGMIDIAVLQSWCYILTNENASGTCAPDALLALGKCYACLSSGEQDIIRLQLLCLIQQQFGGGATCDRDTLLSQGKCFACLGQGELNAIELQLLCEILSASGGCVTPMAPSNTAVAWVSSSALDVTWTDNSIDETGFQVQRSEDGVVWNFTANVGAGVTIYHDVGLLSDVTYYYQVVAFNACGSSSPSPIASETTTAIPMSGLLLWVKPETLVDPSGDPVPTWTDSSTTNNDLVTTPIIGTDPVRSFTSYNGHMGVTLNDLSVGPAAYQSTFALWSGTQPRAMYVVYAIVDYNVYTAFDCGLGQFYDGSVGGQMANGVNNGSFMFQERPSDGCPNFCPFFTGWANDVAMNQGQTFGTARLLDATYNHPTANTYFNGVFTGSAGPLNTVSGLAYFGCDDTGNTLNLIIDLLEVMCYGVFHDATQRAAVETYLRAKYAI